MRSGQSRKQMNTPSRTPRSRRSFRNEQRSEMEARVRVPTGVRGGYDDKRIALHAARPAPFPWAAPFRRDGQSDAVALAAGAGSDPRTSGKNRADRRCNLGKARSDPGRDRAAGAESDGRIGAANRAGVESRAAE